MASHHPENSESDAAGQADSGQYRPVLHRFLMSRLRNSQDASDLVQEAFLRYYALPTAASVSRPDNYLFRIAVNLLYEFRLRRDRDRRLASMQDDEGVDNDPGDTIGLHQQVEHVLGQIPPAYRQVLVLHKRDGLSCKEIADRMNLSVRSVEKYVARALAYARNASWE